MLISSFFILIFIRILKEVLVHPKLEGREEERLHCQLSHEARFSKFNQFYDMFIFCIYDDRLEGRFFIFMSDA